MVMTFFILNNAVCSAIIFFLWMQNRRNFPEIALWFLCYAVQLAGFILILLRGMVFDFMSIVVADMLILTSPLVLLIGIERYLGKKTAQLHNIAAALCFLAAQLYLTFVLPSVPARNVIVSAGFIFFCAQISILSFFRSEAELRKPLRPLGAVTALYVAFNLVRLIYSLISPDKQGFFDAGFVNLLVLGANQFLIVSLTFALIFMLTSFLRGDLERDLVERKRVTEELFLSEKKFSKMFETSPNIIAISRLSDGQMLDVNDAFILKFGWSREEALAGSSYSLQLWVNEFDRAAVVTALTKGEIVVGREYRFRKKNGEILTGVFSAQTIDLREGTCIIATIQDITARKKTEEDLRQNQGFLADLIDYSSVIIVVKSAEGQYRLVNSKWEEVTGLRRENVLGRTDGEIFPDATGEQYRKSDLEVMNFDSVRETEEMIVNAGIERTYLSVKFPLHDVAGSIAGVCGMMTDITERKRNEAIMNHMATHDRLTDLPSLNLARDRILMAIAGARRFGRRSSLLFVDLDGFKSVNDTRGHDAGDRVLKEVSLRLLKCLRQTDTASRIGGDEFLLILTDLQSADDASAIAQKILESISAPFAVDDGEVFISASIGISLCPDDGEDPEILIKAADSAMYRVKDSGKNGWAFAHSPGGA
jgi:diguanylate cyclase (GGDEF)-like protein/PAS domain S-box-containing protein